MLVFDNLELDLGTVQYGENKSGRVHILNNGSTPIAVTPTNASCSCTSGSVDFSTIQPNTNATFTITLNTAKAGRGKQAKSIALSYVVNGQTFSQSFRIKANVI